MAHWHGLAKLRMHTDDTLELLDKTTTSLGNALRLFQSSTCAAFDTKELQREVDARDRKDKKSQDKSKATSKLPSKSKPYLSLRCFILPDIPDRCSLPLQRTNYPTLHCSVAGASILVQPAAAPISTSHFISIKQKSHQKAKEPSFR